VIARFESYYGTMRLSPYRFDFFLINKYKTFSNSRGEYKMLPKNLRNYEFLEKINKINKTVFL